MQQQFVCRAIWLKAVLALSVLLVGTPGSASAHEGHAALPSTGATVVGDQVLVSERARKGLGLTTATVTLKNLSRVLSVRANVELPWDGRAMVSTQVPGRVQAIMVKPGETIDAGQELARIESLEVETLQLTMLQAGEELALAERLLQQRRPLAEKGAIAGKAVLEAETELRQKRVQLALAQKKLMALGLTEEALQEVRTSGEPIASISVTSPISGMVVHSDLRIGQFVDTEQHLFNIVDHSRVLAVGEVLETDAWQVEPGLAVEVGFPALRDRSFIGTIDRQRLRIDPESRALKVVVPIENAEGLLLPGMSGGMEITVYKAEDAIACPIAALINAPGRTFVLVRRGEGKYQRREIKVALRTPVEVEVLKGLFPGDRVVVTGTKLLASMFHTNPVADSPNRGAELSSAARQRVSLTSEHIPVAQAVVEVPTSRKTFATPVIEGRLVRIHVQPGETVEPGQLLAELDSQELRSLQLHLLETQEKLRRIADVIKRVEPLSRSGTYPQAQLWGHELEQKTLQYELQNLERRLAMVGLSPQAIDRLRSIDLSQSDMDVVFAAVPVRAPAAGRLADFDAVLGQVVHTNDALFELQDLRTVWIEGYVFEQHASRVKVGQTAIIRFPAYPDMELRGEVVRAAPTLDSSSARVLPVWIEVENPEQKLREGMLADVEILLQPANGGIAVLPPVRE